MRKQILVSITLIAFVTLSFAEDDVHLIIERSVEANAADWKAASNYDYLERDKQPGGGTKTYEVLMLFGSPYERLVEIDGKPLSTGRQAVEQKKLEATIVQRRNESQKERAGRIAHYEKDRKRDRLLMEQLTKAMDFLLVGQKKLDGYEVYVLKATPRAGYQPTSVETEVLKGMRGELWIDKKTFQWVKVEAQVIHPVSIEGFLARVEPGTQFELEKMPVENNLWFPKHFAMKSRAKILFLFNRRSKVDESYYGYRRVTPVQ